MSVLIVKNVKNNRKNSPNFRSKRAYFEAQLNCLFNVSAVSKVCDTQIYARVSALLTPGDWVFTTQRAALMRVNQCWLVIYRHAVEIAK